jgi:hypothetical protein
MQLSIQTKQQVSCFVSLTISKNYARDVRKPVAKLLKNMAFRCASL